MLIPFARPITTDSPRSVAVSRPDFVAREPLRFEFTAADTDVSVPHDLGREPAGYLVVSRSAGISVYDGSVAHSDALLVLRASGAGVAMVLPL